MANCWLITAFLFVLLAQILSSESSSGLWNFHCIGGSYAKKSHYEMNLRKVTKKIVNKLAASRALFATESVGGFGEDTVYALVQCRGDVAMAACQSCVTQAFKDGKFVCQLREGAAIFRDLCTVGYAKEKVLSFPPDISLSITVTNIDSSQVLIKSNIFHNYVGKLAKVLAAIAMRSPNHFSTGEKEVNTPEYNTTIYALAQCLPSMSIDACGVCLDDLIDRLGSLELTSGRAAMLWCSYRYSLYHFFYRKPTVSLPAEKSHGMVTSPAAKHRKNHIIVWIVVTTSIAAVVGILVVVYLWRKREPLVHNPSTGRTELRGMGDEEESLSSLNSSELQLGTCPSALDSFEDIINLARGKVIALFLDYDGTLAEIVNNPDAAFMSNEMREVLREAARVFPMSVVSGRRRQQVADFVMLDDINYAGSHGMDITIHTKDPISEITEVTTFQPATAFFPLMEKVYRALTEAMKTIDGAAVENNNFCVTAHYRNVDVKYHEQLRNRVHEVIRSNEEFNDLKILEGLMHYDIRPQIDWDKGKAVKYLLDNLHLAERSKVFAIHIGDDRTDEDAFTVLRDEKLGIGIIVTNVNRETSAFFSLKNPGEVMIFIQKLLEWKVGNLEGDLIGSSSANVAL